ncbi:divergent polysaccharide deacetylase family protein [Paenibacillus sp. GYB003]|uniref:divergent polysaccharide deacetylase family protein n=1 Tax=Paenibacillus sp. GYB003 TaxID=2994392 RepID=UPI002F969F62
MYGRGTIRFHKKTALLLTCLTALLAGLSGRAAEADGKAVVEGRRVAIVIDDLGNNMSGTEEVMNAPIPLTVAVMPFLATTKRDAEWAHRVGHDVIVHMPMEPLRGRKSWLGPGAITTDLSEEDIRRKVEAAIDAVPFAVGINNHMGSKATADERVMRVVLDVCKKRGLFYLDSKTNYRSVAPRVASELGVPLVQNEIFLDDVVSTSHITKQLQLIRKRAMENKTCIAIGHVGIPGKKTTAVLHHETPALKGELRFVRLSELVPSTGIGPAGQ